MGHLKSATKIVDLLNTAATAFERRKPRHRVTSLPTKDQTITGNSLPTPPRLHGRRAVFSLTAPECLIGRAGAPVWRYLRGMRDILGNFEQFMLPIALVSFRRETGERAVCRMPVNSGTGDTSRGEVSNEELRRAH